MPLSCTDESEPLNDRSMSGNCPSLEATGLILSTTNVTVGTNVQLSCEDFGHRPTDGTYNITCLPGGDWSKTIPSCRWTWDLTTEEKVVFGTSIAAVSFIIVVVIAIIIAYFCCYKKRKDSEEKLYDSSYHGSSPSPRTGYEGPYNDRDSYPVTYLAYQDINDGKYDGYANTGTLDKPWLGYIPRPKVTEERLYN